MQQNAFDDVDTYTSQEKQYVMLDLILSLEAEAKAAMALGAYFQEIYEGTAEIRDRIARSKYISEANIEDIKTIKTDLAETMRTILAEGGMTKNA